MLTMVESAGGPDDCIPATGGSVAQSVGRVPTPGQAIKSGTEYFFDLHNWDDFWA